MHLSQKLFIYITHNCDVFIATISEKFWGDFEWIFVVLPSKHIAVENDYTTNLGFCC